MLRRTFAILIGSCLVFNVLAQNVGQTGDTLKNYTDINGMKQGHWQVNHPNGKPAYIGYFKNNKPVGKFTRYYKTGKVFSEAFFYDNSKYSTTKMYNNAGFVIAKGRYAEQQRDSIWHFFLDNGKPISQDSYKEGVLHGESRTFFFPSSTLHEIVNYKEGKKHGLYEKYYTDGRIRLRAMYCDGVLCDTMRVFYPSGRVESEIPYVNDLRHGVEKNYSETGKVTSSVPYENGICTDPAVEMRKSKELEEIINQKGKFPDINQFKDPLEFLRKPLK
jgi:antitoxin component YwqK of YwqJK toxin-antitoxin module